MAFSTASGAQMSDMNVTPLVDVMLVLLIIFMVTVPMVNFANPVTIASTQGNAKPITPLHVHIGAGDTISVDGQAVSIEQLQARFATAAALGMVNGKLDASRQPAVELSIEPDAEYGLVARVMSRANNAQLARLSFAK